MIEWEGYKRIANGIIPIATLTLAGLVLSGAFSDRVRHLIRERDRNKSVLSGRTERLECAHIDHNRRNPRYNTPENGRLLTIDEHYIDHVDREGHNGLTIDGNQWGLRAIWGRMTDDERAMILLKGYTEP